MRVDKVDIVIVNWNAGQLLEACLQSLAAGDVSRIAQVVVVDNASVDGSAEVSVQGLPLQIIRSEENLGFGRACNLGVAQGRAGYVLLLNPDTEVGRHTISDAVALLDDPVNADVGVAGIRLVDHAGIAQRHCARSPSWKTFFAESLGLTHLFPGRFSPMIMSDFDHLESRDVDHVIGAFYLVRRELFEMVGGFDIAYFVYLEDLDLSLRIRAAGKRIRYFSEPRAYHYQGGTSEQIKARRLSYSLAAKLIYARKHFSRPESVLVWAGILIIEPLTRIIYAVTRGSFVELLATWQGFAMMYRSLFKGLWSQSPKRGAQ